VKALLLRDDVRLVTLLGPPGIGKTRLSIQVAEQVLPHFADGVCFVDLAPIAEQAMVMPAVGTALALPPAPGLAPQTHIQMGIGVRQLLLILDNFEQVVDGAAAEVAALLRACKGLKVLATSRVRLDIYGEHEYVLPPMSLPPMGGLPSPDTMLDYEAVQLFVARARQHRPDFSLTEETAAVVVEICRRMDGLPLALELAAARVRRMTLTDLAAALRQSSGRDWHNLLWTTNRDLPPRQQTLFNAIGWSHSLLDPYLQSMLAQLSVFNGSFDWPAVAGVVQVPELAGTAVLRDALDRLVDHNLVSLAEDAPERWRLLEMIGEFARGQLDPTAHQALCARHAQHFAAALEALEEKTTVQTYLAEADALADNGRAALRWALAAGEVTLAYRLSASFEWYWERRGLFREGLRFLEQTLVLPGEVEPSLHYDVLHGAANQAWMLHDLDTAHRYTDQALDLAYGRGDGSRIAGFLNLKARIFLEDGRYPEADEALVEGIRMSGLMPREMSPEFMVIQRGEAAFGMGQLDRAKALLEDGLRTVPRTDIIPYCVGWTNLAEVALARGEAAAACESLLQVAPLATLHARRRRFFLIAVAGYLLLKREPDAPVALALLSCVDSDNSRLGDPLSVMGQRLMAARMEEARAHLSAEAQQEALALGSKLSDREAVALARVGLAGQTRSP
jgi:predicted ATPase